MLLIVACAQPSSAITAPELDRAIDQVIHQRQYTWRLPRQHAPEAGSGSITDHFFRFNSTTLSSSLVAISLSEIFVMVIVFVFSSSPTFNFMVNVFFSTL